MAYTHSYRAVTKAEVLTLRLEDWEYLYKHFPNSKVTVLETTFKGEEDNYRDRENKTQTNLIRGRAQAHRTEQAIFTKTASVPTPSTSKSTNPNVSEHPEGSENPEVPSKPPAAESSTFPQFMPKRRRQSEFSEYYPSSIPKTPETPTNVTTSQENSPRTLSETFIKGPSVLELESGKIMYTSTKLPTLEDDEESNLSETIITTPEKKTSTKISITSTEAPEVLSDKIKPEENVPNKREVAKHPLTQSKISSTIPLSEKKSATKETMAAPLKEVEEAIGLLPAVTDSAISFLRPVGSTFKREASFVAMRSTYSLFTDNLAVVTDVEHIDTIDSPSYDDLLIPETEKHTKVPDQKSNILSTDIFKTPSTKYASEPDLPKIATEEIKSRLVNLKATARKVLSLKQLRDDDEEGDLYALEQQEAAKQELTTRGLGTSEHRFKTPPLPLTLSNTEPNGSDISKINLKTFIPQTANRRSVLAFKDDVTTIKVPFRREESLFTVRDVNEKQDANDASMFAYADDVALKEPKKTDSSSSSNTSDVDQFLLDDGDVAPVDSSAKQEKGLTRRKLSD